LDKACLEIIRSRYSDLDSSFAKAALAVTAVCLSEGAITPYKLIRFLHTSAADEHSTKYRVLLSARTKKNKKDRTLALGRLVNDMHYKYQYEEVPPERKQTDRQTKTEDVTRHYHYLNTIEATYPGLRRAQRAALAMSADALSKGTLSPMQLIVVARKKWDDSFVPPTDYGIFSLQKKKRKQAESDASRLKTRAKLHIARMYPERNKGTMTQEAWEKKVHDTVDVFLQKENPTKK
jgi:hypothetical protein